MVVGAGLSGATFARLAHDDGHDVTVIDRRSHVAGNAYTEIRDEQLVHVYGPHIFHCNDDETWQFVNQFATFNRYTHTVKAKGADGKLYSLPFSLQTFNEIYGVTTPAEMRSRLKDVTTRHDGDNVESWCLSHIGHDAYELLVKNYTHKMWGKEPKRLPASVIKRLPLRYTFDTDYFSDRYQGIPRDGYTSLVENMLKGVTVRVQTPFKVDMIGNYDLIVYTGPVDELCDNVLGKLRYRCIEFEHFTTDTSQGCAQLNDCTERADHTRTTEHVLFDPKRSTTLETNMLWQTREFPTSSGDPAYPSTTVSDRKRHARYVNLVKKRYPKMLLLGRLATYRYLNMNQAIAQARKMYRELKL